MPIRSRGPLAALPNSSALPKGRPNPVSIAELLGAAPLPRIVCTIPTSNSGWIRGAGGLRLGAGGNDIMTILRVTVFSRALSQLDSVTDHPHVVEPDLLRMRGPFESFGDSDVCRGLEKKRAWPAFVVF